ncbi:MAG: kinesin motor protein cin8 [Chaenotheca gracillima]|nr:MAG: kinesin motor protein cin8 [Chaenotheca gracillima]
MVYLVQLVAALAATATLVQAGPTCLETQPRTSREHHNGQVLAHVLRDLMAVSKHGLCYGGFSGAGMTTRRSNGSLVVQATRHSKNAHLGPACSDALSSIINSCVSHSNYYGGNITAGQINYAIYNEDYPAPWTPKPLAPSPPRVVPGKPKVSPSTPLPTPVQPPAKTPLRSKAPIPPPANPLPPKPSVPKPAHGPIPSKSVISAHPNDFRTTTLTGVTGSPKSFSQTTTTDVNGHKTVLPVWFGVAGAAVVVIPIAGVAGAAAAALIDSVPPPPPGLPAVEIGPDGQASPRASPEDHSTPTHTLLSSHSPSRRPSSTRPSSASSSASPTASRVAFVITPKESHAQANGAVTNELNDLLAADVEVVNNPSLGLLFWAAALTQAEATHFRANPAVSSVELDTLIVLEEDPPPPPPQPSLGNRRRNSPDTADEPAVLQRRADLTIDTDQPWDLAAVSYPAGATAPTDRYAYDPSAGEGVTIYVVGTGANPDHIDYEGMRNPRWLFVPGAPHAEYEDNEYDDTVNQGTCLVSKAAGAIFGVAKKASVVVVKLPVRTANPRVLRATDYLKSIALLTRDILRTRSRKNVVVIGWRHDFGHIIVGAVRINGATSPTSQGGNTVDIGAPGYGIPCASHQGVGNVQISAATPPAAAMAAGLAAYLMALPEFQADIFPAGGDLEMLSDRVRLLMLGFAYPRGQGTLPVINNRENGLDDDSCSVGKRFSIPKLTPWLPVTSKSPPPSKSAPPAKPPVVSSPKIIPIPSKSPPPPPKPSVVPFTPLTGSNPVY